MHFSTYLTVSPRTCGICLAANLQAILQNFFMIIAKSGVIYIYIYICNIFNWYIHIQMWIAEKVLESYHSWVDPLLITDNLFATTPAEDVYM